MLGVVLLPLSLHAPVETTLRDIPSIMRAKGWTRGAYTMETWFEGKARVAREEGGFDFTLPTVIVPGLDIAYTLTCPGARAKYEGLTGAAFWSGPKAGAALKKKTQGLLASLKPGVRTSFGERIKPPGRGESLKAFHDSSVESASVAALATFSVPDLFSSLGGFAYFAIPRGTVTKSADGQTATFEITDLSVYVIDCYHWHTESRPFGWWKRPDVASPLAPPSPEGYVAASDAAFNDYRKATGRGGDYLVFLPPVPFHFPDPVETTVSLAVE